MTNRFIPQVSQTVRMELAYLPDGLLYINGRSNVQQSFWTDINSTKCRNKTSDNYDPKINEKNCHICKDKKMKSLSSYIRTKSRRDSEPSTHIREEDEDENALKNCKDTKKS